MAGFWQTLRGPFSAVSTPIFASKYSFESSWRDLQELHLCVFYTLLHRSVSEKSKFSLISSNIFTFLQFYFYLQSLMFCKCSISDVQKSQCLIICLIFRTNQFHQTLHKLLKSPRFSLFLRLTTNILDFLENVKCFWNS